MADTPKTTDPEPAPPALNELEKLLPVAIASLESQFKDLSETWRHLDTKAQGAGAIAGIFLAAALAWAKELAQGLELFHRGMIIASVIVLILAVVVAVGALQIRQLKGPAFGTVVANMVLDIYSLEQSEVRDRLVGFYRDQINLWEQCNTEMRTHLEEKSYWLQIAHGLLILSGILVAIVVISKLGG